MSEHLTGYPSIDKPWLKYYQKGKTNERYDKRTIYELIFLENKDNLDDLALLFFGKRISYKTLFDEVNKCERSLLSIGLKRGDCINLLTAGVPESVYLVLACSRIGVMANFVNPLFDALQMRDRINDTNASWMFVLDVMYGYAEGVIEKTCTENVVVIPISESFPLPLKAVANVNSKARKITKGEHKVNYILWGNFIKKGATVSNRINERFIEDTPTVMVYSSGSTGASKGIVHTNESITATIKDSLSSNLELKREMAFLQMIPIWFSTGIVQSILLPLYVGVTVILEPQFSPEAFVKDCMKYKPTMTLVATSIWMAAIKDEHFKNVNLSELRYPFTGGEKLIASSERELNTFLKEHKCPSLIVKGYGMCELGGKVTDTLSVNKESSVGIPMADITVGIFDPYTNDELTYGHRGEIRVDTPAHMKEYYKNPTATEEFFWVDRQGRRWGCTGDIGYMDENGLLYVLGRASDNWIDECGKTVYLFEIEEEIIKDESISQCKVVPSEIDGMQELVAHIVLRDSNSDETENLKRIHDMLLDKMPDNMIPNYFKVRTSMPVHNNGKRDVDALMSETEGFVKVK